MVKISERLNIIKDVEFYIGNNASEVQTVKGFNDERMCEYTIKAVKKYPCRHNCISITSNNHNRTLCESKKK